MPYLEPHLFLDSVLATGSGVEMRIDGMATLAVDIEIQTTATVVFEVCGASKNWVAFPMQNIANGSWAVGATASGYYRADVTGLSYARMRVSAWSAGTVRATGLASEEAPSIGATSTGTPSTALAPTNSSGNAPSNATVAAYAASLVVKASAGTLFGLSGYNSKVSAQFIQLHDAAALPADTAVPVVVITVPAGANFAIDFGVYGRRFATGIVVTNSSTGPTKTIGAADCWFDAQYV